MKRIILVLIVLLILCGYLFITKPDKVVISEKGNVEGLFNKGRALIQGERFWKYQLQMANEFLEKNNQPKLPSSAETQALFKKIRDEQRQLDDKMKDLFTKDELIARGLRYKADSIELAAKWRNIDDAAETERVQELEKYRKVVPLIERRLHITKEQTGPAVK